jgi:hypothetical protein
MEDSSRLHKSHKLAPEGYYTASEAEAKLKLARSSFRWYVDQDYIPRHVPLGKSEGFYLAALIDALEPIFARRDSYSRKEFRDLIKRTRDQIIPQETSLLSLIGETDWIRPDDLAFVQKLDLDRYGPDQTVDMKITSRWWEKNPYMCRILFNSQDRRDVWGALTIMPLFSEDLIFRLLRQEIPESDIRPEDIPVYEEGKSYTGYIASVIIRPEYNTRLRSLIQSVLDFWCERYPSIQLNKLYAYGSTPEGRMLIRHLYFSRRYDIGKNAWELDPMDEDNPARFIRDFQRCIEHKPASDLRS